MKKYMKRYAFESMNAGTIEVEVFGEYWDSECKDILASIEHKVRESGCDYKEWTETNDADEIMQWLVDEGVEFESDRSMAFNRDFIQYVLIEREQTKDELIREAAGWSKEEIDGKLYWIDR